MARIAESELERLKREVSVARLAEARGVKLQRVGSDLKGLCPFRVCWRSRSCHSTQSTCGTSDL